MFLLPIVEAKVFEKGRVFLMNEFYFYCVLASLLFILLGIVLALDFQNVLEKKKYINVQQLILGLILSIIGLVPSYYLRLQLLSDINQIFKFILRNVQSQYVHYAINMIAGILIGQSIRFKT